MKLTVPGTAAPEALTVTRKVDVFTDVGSSDSLNVATILDNPETPLWPLVGDVLVTTGGVTSVFDVRIPSEPPESSQPSSKVRPTAVTKNRFARFDDCSFDIFHPVRLRIERGKKNAARYTQPSSCNAGNNTRNARAR